MSSLEQRTQKFTQGLIQKQAKIWYEDWSQNWVAWIVILIIILIAMWWLLNGRELPDICNLRSDSESEPEVEDLELGDGSEFLNEPLTEEHIRIDPLTGAIIRYPDDICETSGMAKDRKFGSKGERITCETLEKVYQVPFPTVRPNFLKNPETKRNLELDCYNEDLKIAAEYNGEQHYNFPNRFHKTKQEFLKQIRRDRLKAELCELRGIHLITIPWTIGHQMIADYIKFKLPENIEARTEGKSEPIPHRWTN